MKFAQQLRDGAVEEWRREYVDYRLLKKLIKAAARSEGDSDEQPLNLPDHNATSPESSGFPLPLDTSSDDEGHSTRQQSQRPPAEPSGNRLASEQSRSSAQGEPTSNGLRSRMRSNKSASVRESRWRYPPDLPYDKLMKALNPQERKFFTVLDGELEKVESFYEERESEALKRYKVLREQLDQLAEHKAKYAAAHGGPRKILQPILYSGPKRLKERVTPDGADSTGSPGSGTPNHQRNKSEGTADPDPQPSSRNFGIPNFNRNAENYVTARRKLKVAVFEFYKYLGYVKNYHLLNKTGFSKSTKKMEKVTRIRCQEAFMQKVEKAYFSRSTVVEDLQRQTETMFSTSFEKGSRKKAVQRLRFMGAGSKTHHFATWRAGLMIGAAIPALIDAAVKAARPDVQARIPQHPALLQLYGAMVLPVLLALGIGVNLLTWSNAHINIPLVFYFDARTHIDFREYLEIPSVLFLWLVYCFWLSFTIVSDTFTPQVWPLVWFFSAALFIFNPIPILYPQARWWIVRSTFRVFTAGLLQVQFRDFWLGDQFTSLYYTTYNFGLLVCVYTHHFSPSVNKVCSTNETWTTPVLATLPYMWRLGQSIRRFADAPDVKTHLVNAGKYAAGILYYFMYFNWRIRGANDPGLFALFVVFATINSVYAHIWDVLMDWNLFKRNSRHRFLRNELAFKNYHWFYYFAIVSNFLLRFSWLVYLSGTPDLRFRGFMVGLIELIRRWQWNFIRVESEHVGNVDGYRVTRDVALPYTIPHMAGNHNAGNDDQDDSDDVDQGPQAKGEKEASHELGARKSPFGAILPGMVGQRLRTAIGGGNRVHADESDDEDDDDSPTDGAPASASPNKGKSKNGRDGSQAETQDAPSRPSSTGTSTAVADERHRNYNTFGWDSDVENLRTPDGAHVAPSK